MPSPTYTATFSIISSFIPKEKASDILDRYITRSKMTPDGLTTRQLTEILFSLIGAAQLYIPERSRRDLMTEKLKALCG